MINYKEFLAGGRRWEGVFSGRGCFWMWNASSSASLRCKFLCWSKTVTPFQSTLWLALHACSAIADTLKSAIFTALLCSSIFSHSFFSHVGGRAFCTWDTVDYMWFLHVCVLHPPVLPIPQVHMWTATPHQMTLGCPSVLASVSVWRIQTLTSWWHESLYYQQVGPRSGLDVLKAGKMGNAQWSDWSEGSLEWQGEDCTLLCDIALCAWIGRNGSSVTL